MARAHVYVYDETMRVALEKVMQHRPKPEGQAETPEEEDEESVPKRSAGSIVEVREWLDGLVTPQSVTGAQPERVTESPEPQIQSVVYDAEAEAKAAAEFDEKYAEYEDRMADDSYWLEKQPSVPETPKSDVVRGDVPKPESTARPENRWSLLKKRPRR